MIEILLKLIFANLIYPLALQIALKRETDAVFKAATDQLYSDLGNAKTTADRKAAARKLYELQKNN